MYVYMSWCTHAFMLVHIVHIHTNLHGIRVRYTPPTNHPARFVSPSLSLFRAYAPRLAGTTCAGLLFRVRHALA